MCQLGLVKWYDAGPTCGADLVQRHAHAKAGNGCTADGLTCTYVGQRTKTSVVCAIVLVTYRYNMCTYMYVQHHT